jgi:SnoaL-like domain
MGERHDGGTARDLIGAFLDGDARGMLDRLADDAVFHSPAADYDDRATIAAVLGALTQVVRDAEPTSLVQGPDQAVAFFTATVEGRRGDGMLRVVAPGGGPASDVTLMVRPLRVLLAGVEEMKRRLAPAA